MSYSPLCRFFRMKSSVSMSNSKVELCNPISSVCLTLFMHSVQEDRFEELRDTHRLESSSQSLQIEKLCKEISEAEVLLKAAQRADAQAEETAQERKTEIDNLRKELERTKLLAKEEEEKRVKAISLLKTVRQKLVKAEKEKEDATAAVTLLQEKGREETEREQTEKSKLRNELDTANLEREKALAALKIQFDKEITSLKVQYDQDIATYKGKSETELDTLKVWFIIYYKWNIFNT